MLSSYDEDSVVDVKDDGFIIDTFMNVIEAQQTMMRDEQ